MGRAVRHSNSSYRLVLIVMRVLLTGARGFIGLEMLAALQEYGAEIHALVRPGVEATKHPHVHLHACDLLRDDVTPLLGHIAPTHLVHLAWVSDRTQLWHGTANLDWVAASLRLVRAFHAIGGKRAVLAGSAAEYDWSHHTLDETRTPLRPHTLYGKAKCALHDLLSQMNDKSLSIAFARIFFPIGPFDKDDRLLSAVIDGVAAGRPVSCSEGRQVRPFLHVADAARGIGALLLSDVQGAVNIALNEVCSVHDLVLCAATRAGDPALIAFGTQPLQLGEPPFMRASVERLTSEVGFRPRFSIEEAVHDTVDRRLANPRWRPR